jgi:hypothetical protein
MANDKQDQELMSKLLQQTVCANASQASEAAKNFAMAISLPLRQELLAGDITYGIFEVEQLAPGQTPEYPLDFLAPGTAKDFVAYTNPQHGYIPERTVEGDYVMVPTYGVANSIDWLLRYSRDARWNIVERALDVLRAGFVKKINDDAWHVLMAAGVDRNFIVWDADANVGQFTKRLVSLMKSVMRRNGGGNSTSMNRGMLTDVFLSPENKEDVRNWGIDIVDDFTRREIFLAEDGAISRIWGVNLVDVDEFGESQEYQDFFTGSLGGSLASGDVELLVGLDLRNRDSFVMPMREQVQLFQDPTLHRRQRDGYYGWAELGLAALDNRRVCLGSS